MEQSSKALLVLDLDHTLFHTIASHKSILRPYCKEFLASVSKWYKIIVFTMGTREYGKERCESLGLTHWIQDNCIFGREDALVDETGHKWKTFNQILCKKCQKHCVAVDDHPTWWKEKGIDWKHNPRCPSLDHGGYVLRICPFSKGDNNDKCLMSLEQLLIAKSPLLSREM